jgi:hypothetical protein
MAKKLSQSKSVQKLGSQIVASKKNKLQKRVSNSYKANLKFPVGRVTRLMR